MGSHRFLGPGAGAAREAPTGPSCSWKFIQADTHRVDVSAQEKNPNGLPKEHHQSVLKENRSAAILPDPAP
ncbi:hypothetical protein [Nocardia fusca]|uniref:hypothetical protein n=1 Tax=Nocardia fusca TaxID=941183 RepID=UPI0018DEA1BE|nr:hypothetical protein [Nocardia fusca]